MKLAMKAFELNGRISCQYLYFAQTEDIWLKSAMEGKSGVSLSSRKEVCIG